MADASSSGPPDVHAQRIRFADPQQLQFGPGEAALPAKFTEPLTRVAVARTVSPEELLSAATVTPPPVDRLDVLCLPSGSAAPLKWQRRAEAWMNDPALAEAAPTIDLVVQSDRILWRPGRAVIIAAERRVVDLVAGLLEFTFHEGQLRRLEGELAAEWPTAERDAELTHRVGAGELRRQDQVDEMTRKTVLRRIHLTRLTPRLENAPLQLPGPARRLVHELAQQAEVADRLEYVDDRLEVFEDLYELANDRLTEFSYFHREYWLELWIIVLLIGEVVIMLGEIWLAWWLEHGA